MTRRVLLAAVVLVVCFAAAPSALADGSSSTAPTIVEVVRYTAGPGGTIVRHDILIDSTATSDAAQAADQAVEAAQTQPGPTCQSTPGQGEVVAQYCLNSWSWKPANIPVHVSYNPAAPAGLTVPSALAAIQNAVQQWSSVTPNFSFVYDGTTTAQPTACNPTSTADGVNTVAWVNGIGGNKAILAQTCTIQNPDGSLAEFDMELNAQQNFSDLTPTPVGKFDLYSNILHEFGHAAGLAHSQYPSAVMFESLLPSIEKRTLTLDDINGLKAKYGFPMQQYPLRWVVGGLVVD